MSSHLTPQIIHVSRSQGGFLSISFLILRDKTIPRYCLSGMAIPVHELSLLRYRFFSKDQCLKALMAELGIMTTLHRQASIHASVSSNSFHVLVLKTAFSLSCITN